MLRLGGSNNGVNPSVRAYRPTRSIKINQSLVYSAEKCKFCFRGAFNVTVYILHDLSTLQSLYRINFRPNVYYILIMR